VLLINLKLLKVSLKKLGDTFFREKIIPYIDSYLKTAINKKV